jgi:hypothetical protein
MRGWKDQLFKTADGAVNLHARDMAADAEQAMSLAASADVEFCQYTSTILCLEEEVSLRRFGLGSGTVGSPCRSLPQTRSRDANTLAR